MSGNSAKIALGGAALVGIGFATGGFGLAGASTMFGSTATALGGPAGIAASMAGGGGSLFAGMSGFQAASLGMGALSMGSNVMGGISASQNAKIQMQQIEAEQRRRNIQALQDKAAALQNFNKARGTAMAKSAAGGQATDRDMMQTIKKGEEYLQDELGNIAVNAATSRTVAGLQMASADNTGRAGVVQGFMGGGRSLLTSYRDYSDSRTA